MSDVKILHNFVGGDFIAPSTGQYIDNVNPALGRVIAHVPRSTRDDVNAAVASAKEAFADWSQRPFTERADLLDAIASRIEARHDELVALESRDSGKPVKLARTVDIPRSAANFRFFAGAIRHDSTDFHAMQGKGAINYTLRKSVGVAGLITPWNLPLYLLSWKVAPALAMGNTVVAKPSELTPMSANILAEIFDEVGAPKGIFNLVHGLGNEAGQAIVEHRDVSLVSFTGGTSTGRQVAATAAPMFKKISMELGGKNPTIVFADADFDETLAGALRAGFTNQGQVCLCGSRLLVQRPIFDAFSKALAERVAAMQVGDPSHPDTDLGALVSLAHREKVEGYIALGLEEGGTILAGGQRPDLGEDFSAGAFLQPTLIAGLEPSSRTATEEIFGPVVTLHPFDTEEEAIAIANGVPYGLAASVWTSDLKRAHRVSEKLDSGMVWVNTWLMRDLRVPFGGMKESGVGREGGKYSMSFFSESRNVCIKL
ncbi:MAG: aldehyde dehydrogenase [Myxococcota bacterium]|nr:aldehyde dehydrogenase [Myxococcota bacterium]